MTPPPAPRHGSFTTALGCHRRIRRNGAGAAHENAGRGLSIVGSSAHQDRNSGDIVIPSEAQGFLSSIVASQLRSEAVIASTSRRAGDRGLGLTRFDGHLP